MSRSVDGRLQRALGGAGSKGSVRAQRCPAVIPTITTSPVRHGLRRASAFAREPGSRRARRGILEMDEPDHSIYQGALNPYLSPAAVGGGRRSSTRSPGRRSTRRSSRAASASSTTWPT